MNENTFQIRLLVSKFFSLWTHRLWRDIIFKSAADLICKGTFLLLPCRFFFFIRVRNILSRNLNKGTFRGGICPCGFTRAQTYAPYPSAFTSVILMITLWKLNHFNSFTLPRANCLNRFAIITCFQQKLRVQWIRLELGNTDQ